MAFDSTEVAWRDLEVFLNGVRITKITALRYKTSIETEQLYGAGDEPFDINTANRSYEGEMRVYKSVIDVMNTAAAAAGGRDLHDIQWIIVANYKATLTSPRKTVTLPNVRFGESEEGMEGNSKSMIVSLPFKCLQPIKA